MRKLLFSVLLMILVGAMLVIPASASTVYSSGTANGAFNAWEISQGSSVSDSFTLSQAQYIYGATFVAWLGPVNHELSVTPGDTMSSVNWSIGTSAFGTQYGSGTAITTNLSSVYNSSPTVNADINTLSFSDIGVELAAGTYYLTLSGAVVTGGSVSDTAYWDENDGSSNGYSSILVGAKYNGLISNFDATPGNLSGSGDPGLTGGETFTLNNPEPSSFLLMGSGLLGLAGLLKRKLAA